MINLIPPEGVALVVREYWVRTISVWALLCSGACVLVVGLFAPTYVLLSSQLKAAQEETRESDLEEQYKGAEVVIVEANEIIRQLSRPQTEVQTSGILEAIRDIARDDIRLSYFQIVTEERGGSVRVQGTAATREALATFKTDLERSPLFESAVVPISDLARDVNLPFAITIVLDPLTMTNG